MQQPVLVLDANILIRAILGTKVSNLIITFNELVTFLVPDICFVDAQKYLPSLFKKRNLPPELALKLLNELKPFIQIVEQTIYQEHAVDAKKRIETRDLQDWPIVATALTFNSSVWTEDQDFFGSGLAVWTTDRIHLFFEALGGSVHSPETHVYATIEED
jgi:predicted nucleic acid-binding protein